MRTAEKIAFKGCCITVGQTEKLEKKELTKGAAFPIN